MRATAASGALACVAAFLCSFAVLFARTTQAAELPDATLVVTRGADAAECPDETTLAQRVESRLARDRTTLASGSRLLLNVAMTHQGAEYVATVTVEGRKQGVRTLRADGPTCAALQEALVVALLVLVDADPSRSGPEPPPADVPALQAVPRTPAPREPEPEPALPAPRHVVPARPHPALWIGGGWELSHGLPVGLSSSAFGELTLKGGPWQVGGAFLWAPSRSIEAAPGAIDVSVMGGRLSGCYVRSVHRRVSVGACALGQLVALSGRGVGFVDKKAFVRPWASAGAGALVDVALSPRIAVGITLNLLATLHRQRFSVTGIEDRYQTDAVTGGGGMHLRVLLW
jgi:hypothetical protein